MQKVDYHMLCAFQHPMLLNMSMHRQMQILEVKSLTQQYIWYPLKENKIRRFFFLENNQEKFPAVNRQIKEIAIVKKIPINLFCSPLPLCGTPCGATCSPAENVQISSNFVSQLNLQYYVCIFQIKRKGDRTHFQSNKIYYFKTVLNFPTTVTSQLTRKHTHFYLLNTINHQNIILLKQKTNKQI